jgi:hypothetical protein
MTTSNISSACQVCHFAKAVSRVINLRKYSNQKMSKPFPVKICFAYKNPEASKLNKLDPGYKTS